MELEDKRKVNRVTPGTSIACSVVILTYNSAATIERTVKSAQCVSDDIHVVDSFSIDGTVEILRRLGVRVVQHEFRNYSAQRNWAIENLPCRHRWQLHLDADEYLSARLIEEIAELSEHPADNVSGYYIPRQVRFLGRTIRHGGMYPIWHLRLFLVDKGRCEDREYDQHFYVDGPVRKLKYCMVDDQRMSLSEWTLRHNRWAEAEALEVLEGNRVSVIKGKWSGSPVQRKRSLRRVYYRAPLFLRALGLFLYRYIFRLGFLDGKAGLVFFALQTFWFRFLVDAKIFEMEQAAQDTDNIVGCDSRKRAGSSGS